MEAYQERVKAECNELNEKYNKLTAFLKTDTFAALHHEDKGLLNMQHCAMYLYLNILTDRIMRFYRES
jgi:hypothetical protein